jgi:two-component system, chemotaxis family, chemotaxis protein CheY
MMLREMNLKLYLILSPGASINLQFNYTFLYLRKGKYMKWELLLLDDEPCILDALAELLTEDDITVTKAKNGVEGLQLLKERHFDVVVSDINMPLMDGITMFYEARASNIFVSHIFFSAYVEPKISESLKLAGVAAIVQKPHFEKLSAEINSVLVKTEFMHPFGSQVIHPVNAFSGDSVTPN